MGRSRKNNLQKKGGHAGRPLGMLDVYGMVYFILPKMAISGEIYLKILTHGKECLITLIG